MRGLLGKMSPTAAIIISAAFFALIHLKQYFGKIAVLDHEGFYQPLKELLQHYVQTGMLSQETMDRIVFAQTPDQLLDMIED